MGGQKRMQLLGGLLLTLILILGVSQPASATSLPLYYYHTDIKVLFDGHPLNAFNANGKTAIIVEDLEWYFHFTLEWNPEERTVYIDDHNGGSSHESIAYNLQFRPADYLQPSQGKVGSIWGQIYPSDIRAYLNNREIPSLNIGGRTAIFCEDLADYGYLVTWDETQGLLSVSYDPQPRYLESDLGLFQAYRMAPERYPSFFSTPYAYHLFIDGDYVDIGAYPESSLGGAIPLKATLEALQIDYTWEAETNTLYIHSTDIHYTPQAPPAIAQETFWPYLEEPVPTIDPAPVETYSIPMRVFVEGTEREIEGLVYHSTQKVLPMCQYGVVYFPLLALTQYLGLESDGSSNHLYTHKATGAPRIGLAPSSLPPVNAYGYQAYTYGEYQVVDWLGDAQTLRDALYPQIYRPTDAILTPDYHVLFLGRPIPVGEEGNEGVLIPAGICTDGEWMPDLYYLNSSLTSPSKNRNFYVTMIQGVSYRNNPWYINTSFLETPTQNYRVYYGVFSDTLPFNLADGTPIDAEMNLDGQPVLMATDSRGASQDLLRPAADYGYQALPQSYLHQSNYFAALIPDSAELTALTAFYPLNQQKFQLQQPELGSTLSSQSTSFLPWPFRPVPQWEGLPQLKRQDDPSANWGHHLYAANFKPPGQDPYLLDPTPLTQIYWTTAPEILENTQVPPLYLDYGQAGPPTQITAQILGLHNANGSGFQNLPLSEQNQIQIPELEPGQRYLLHVRADYGEQGYLEWAWHFQSTGSLW